jgi:HlyD family secretion protein
MHLKTVIPIVVVVLILGAATLYFEFFRGNGENPNLIQGSGTIEVTEIQLSSKMAGRIVNLPVEEGTVVAKGDLLVELDHDMLQAQLDAAKATLQNAEQLYRRVKTLYNAGSQSTQDYENALSNYRVALANYKLMEASIRDATLSSPLNATVLQKNMEPGEMAFPGSAILTLGDLTNPWMNIYVTESDLGRVRLGQKAEVTVDSFPGKTFSGKVINIAEKAEFTPKTIQTKEERVKLMYAVKIAISNPGGELKPGMPADARIIVTE